MLHPSVLALYERQRTLFRRLTGLAFAAAGTYWIAIYAVSLASVISNEDIAAFRSGQTLPYFILLTLWGVEHFRNSRRLQSVILLANERRVAPQEITAEDLGSEIARFDILLPAPGRSWIAPLLNILGTIAAYYLIIQQYLAIIRLFVSS